MLFFLHFYHNSEILEYIESMNDVSFDALTNILDYGYSYDFKNQA